MAHCSSCGNPLAFLETIKSLSGAIRCDQCSMKFDQAKNYWLGAMQQQFHQGGVSADFEQALYRNLQQIRMPPDLGQPIVQHVQYLRTMTETNRLHQMKNHWLAVIQQEFDQGGVSTDLEQQVKQNLQEIRMPPQFGQPVMQRLHYLRNKPRQSSGNKDVQYPLQEKC